MRLLAHCYTHARKVMWSEFWLMPGSYTREQNGTATTVLPLVRPAAVAQSKWEARLRALRGAEVKVLGSVQPERSERGTGARSPRHLRLATFEAVAVSQLAHDGVEKGPDARRRRRGGHQTIGAKSLLQVNVQFAGDSARRASAVDIRRAINRVTWGTGRGDAVFDNLPLHLVGSDLDTAFRAASQGALSFPSVLGAVVTIELPGTAAGHGECPTAQLSNEAPTLLKALTPAVDPASYDFVHFILPTEWGPECGFSGLGFIGSDYPILSFSKVLDKYLGPSAGFNGLGVSTLAGVQQHEIGHNIGFLHSTDLENGYGDATCTMGSAGPLVFNAPKLWGAGWLSAGSQVLDKTGHINCDDSTQVTLSSLQTTGTGGTKVVLLDRSKELALKVEEANSALGDTCAKAAGSYWFVSYRGSIGDDQFLPHGGQNLRNKVYVHYALKTGASHAAVSTLVTEGGLGPGESFGGVNDNVGAFSVTVESISESEATVLFDFCGSAVTVDEECDRPDNYPCDLEAVQESNKAAGYFKAKACITVDSKCGRLLVHSRFGMFERRIDKVCNNRAVYTQVGCTGDSCLDIQYQASRDKYYVHPVAGNGDSMECASPTAL